MGLSNEEIAQMMADDCDDGVRQWILEGRGPDGYRMVEWPFCQKYMDEEWFDEEAYLDITDQYGDCAYWIPGARINSQAAEEILYDELVMLERSIMSEVKSVAETTFYGLDRDPLDMDETKRLGMLVEHVANICYGNYNKEEVHKARIKLILELQHPLEYRIEERARLDTFGWMTAQELMEQGQPVKHLSIPGRKFYRYMGTIICEQDDGVKHKMSDVAAKAVLQALLPQGWRIA